MIIGIDPGYTGAIAILDRAGQPRQVIDIPLVKGAGKVKDEIDERAIYDFMDFARCFGPRDEVYQCYIEKVHAMPGQGVASTFRFGVSYGIVRAVAACLGYSTHFISPPAWRAAVGLPKSPDRASGKALARQRAAQLFPKFAPEFSRVKDGGRAEAVLIALAGHKLLA